MTAAGGGAIWSAQKDRRAGRAESGPRSWISLRKGLSKAGPCGPAGWAIILWSRSWPVPRFVFSGGGHISAHLAPLASLVDFRVTVLDDRDEFASPERFPLADEVICRPFTGAVESLKIKESGYVVIVTRGHAWDGVILGEVLKTPAAYIGMIGSRHKRDAIYEKLLSEGYTDSDLERVHSPIGLDIGGETPEEIAVAIVAELIKARSEAVRGPGPKNWKV